MALPTLTSGKGAQQAALDLQSRPHEPAPHRGFDDHWRLPDVLGALIAMHGRVCAYCQCGLPHNDRGQVEHFRPKSIYWWLAYEFSNYLLSCSTCNHCKLNVFPLLNDAAPLTWRDRDRLHEEKALFLDPVADEVEDWLHLAEQHSFFYAVPAKAIESRPDLLLRVETTIERLWLNRNSLRLKERSETIRSALEMHKAVETGDLSNARELRRMASRFQPHGAAIRRLLEERGAARFLPSPEEEVEDFVKDLIAELRAAEANRIRTGEEPEARFWEVLWALAILWKCPPVGTPAWIEGLLVEAGWRDDIALFLARI